MMLNRLVSLPGIAILTAILITAWGFIFSMSNMYEGLKAAGNVKGGEATAPTCKERPTAEPKSTIRDSFFRLYEAIRHHPASPSYTDAYGNVFEIKEDGPYWKEPLRNEILIVDIDTRVPEGPNNLWHKGRMNWETLKEEGDGGMISASQMNHFLYAQAHGYDYRFFKAHDMDGLHNTWVKPHALLELLPSYKFVAFIDADATVQHLEVPLEWMFNRWGITPTTTIAMPIDVRQMMGGNDHIGEDENGRMEANTGVIIAQNLPSTMEMLTSWKECPNEKRYPGCGRWKEEWAHEQRAFSLYIRYDLAYNSSIVEISCDDAMGFPGLGDNGWIADDCKGQFIRHHTIAKTMTKRSTEIAMLQSITDLAKKELMRNKETYWIDEKQLDYEKSKTAPKEEKKDEEKKDE